MYEGGAGRSEGLDDDTMKVPLVYIYMKTSSEENMTTFMKN